MSADSIQESNDRFLLKKGIGHYLKLQGIAPNLDGLLVQ
jgi:hypothetical protein